jgi:hypothetical protein
MRSRRGRQLRDQHRVERRKAGAAIVDLDTGFIAASLLEAIAL